MSHRKFTDNQEHEIGRMYEAGWTYDGLARWTGVGVRLIGRILKRQGINPRRMGAPTRLVNSEEIEKVRILYASGMSQQKIEEAVGVSQAVISRVLRQLGVTRPRLQNRDGHGHWKGGRTLTSGGYVEVYPDPTEVLAAPMRHRNGYVLEHRLAMAHKLGRPLLAHETVHHKNGEKQDNRPENLELRVGRHGVGATIPHCPTCTCFKNTED